MKTLHHCRRTARVLSGLCVALWWLWCLSGCRPKSPEQRVPSSAAVVPLTNMIAIKAGTFMRIKFPVTIGHDFWMGKYEVTQGEFMAILGRNPSHFIGDSNRPVEKITFFDAVNFCAALTRREQKAGRLPAGYE